MTHDRLVPWLLFGCVLTLLLAPPRELSALEIHWAPLSAKAGGGKGTVQLASGHILATHERHIDGEHQVVCSRSVDGGRTWKELSVIATQNGPATVGDGHLLQLPTGEVLFSYRHNLLGEEEKDPRNYSIRVSISRDGGRNWRPHSTVATSSHDPRREPDALRGLWSSFLLLTDKGELQCYYDDEETPHREGFLRHQWLTMRTWDAESKQWVNPVTVSRAHNPAHLSRDGMPSILQLASGRLLCAFESVQTAPPHANLIRFTTSDDGGKTWSWVREERGLLYESPGKPRHLSISPWLARTSNGRLVCVFATDEDREVPGISGTPPHQLYLDIKYTHSADDGRTWSRPAALVFGGGHRNYVPGIVELQDGSLLVTFLDFAAGAHRAMRGLPAHQRN
jgi:hypothetical protein